MSEKILVSEIFGPTIQGEGAMIGVQTHFVRFAGCDYRCTMCDSMYAVDPEIIHKEALRLGPEEIADKLIALNGDKHNIKWVTFSGGNPCIWDLTELIYLIEPRFKIAVETQGTIWQNWLLQCNQITISPKGPGMGEKHDPKVFDAFIMNLTRRGLEQFRLKVVIMNEQDIEFAEEIHELYPTVSFYISVGNPLFGMDDYTAETIRTPLLDAYDRLIARIANRPKLADATILPQMHVLLWGNRRGV